MTFKKTELLAETQKLSLNSNLKPRNEDNLLGSDILHKIARVPGTKQDQSRQPVELTGQKTFVRHLNPIKGTDDERLSEGQSQISI